jgi:prevent-host-death family protein
MKIKASSALRNKYPEISEYVHETNEPVFITKNGEGDTVLISMSLFDKFMHPNQTYALYQERPPQAFDGHLEAFEHPLHVKVKKTGREQVYEDRVARQAAKIGY